VQYERRSFGVDVETCPRCGGRMSIVPGYTVDKFTFRAEFRYDNSSKEVFNNSDGVVNKKSQQTAALGVHYMF
jgi:hypothetical protein